MSTALLDMKKHVTSLRDGRRLQDLVGLILQILLIIAAFCLVGIWWKRWFAGDVELKFFGWIALVIWQLAWPVAAFLALQALFLSASEIRQLPPAYYTVAPMMEKLLRGIGEAVIATMVIMAVPAMLVVWFNGVPLARHLLPGFPCLASVLPFVWGAGARFWPGLAALLALPLQGLVVLIASYFSGEAVIAVFAIAEDLRKLRTRSDAADADKAD